MSLCQDGTAAPFRWRFFLIRTGGDLLGRRPQRQCPRRAVSLVLRLPPCISMMARDMARPRPIPSWVLLRLSSLLCKRPHHPFNLTGFDARSSVANLDGHTSCPRGADGQFDGAAAAARTRWRCPVPEQLLPQPAPGLRTDVATRFRCLRSSPSTSAALACGSTRAWHFGNHRGGVDDCFG